MKKKCQNCGKKFEVKVLGEGHNNHRKYCKGCPGAKVWRHKYSSRYAFLQNRWAKNNPEKAKARWRRHRLKTKYGLTIQEFERLLKTQKNRCAICRRKFNGRWNAPNVDHKHGRKGTHRGLLCVDCNLLIGHSLERVKTLIRAIGYLKKWR